MRIISKQKDYYDFSMAYGIDTTICYNRKPRCFHMGQPEFKALKKFEPSTRWVGEPIKRDETETRMFIVIGGVLKQVFYNSADAKKDKAFSNPRLEPKPLWNYYSFGEDTIDVTADYAWINDLFDDPIVVFGAEHVNPWLDIPLKNFASWEESLKGRYDETVVTDIKYSKDSISVGAPILHMLDLQAIMTGQEVWTLIENYLTSDRTKMPKFDDKLKIQSAGFDLKTSFRKGK